MYEREVFFFFDHGSWYVFYLFLCIIAFALCKSNLTHGFPSSFNELLVTNLKSDRRGNEDENLWEKFWMRR